MCAARTALKALAFFLAGALAIAAMLFVPAGTLDYWQAWAYLAVLLVPMVFVLAYFLAKDPDFLERRFQMKEKEKTQEFVQKFGAFIFLIGFMIPGLDRRHGWSQVPFELVVAADIAVALGYALVFLVFRQNSFAGRTIRVEKGQKVVSTGVYSIVRHPMYVGMIVLYLSTPIALGSYFALVPFLLVIPMMVLRIKNEEQVLSRELEGYKEYCGKVRYRLLPGAW
ncbi:MAG: isoprenylcysteine carboxylmethyltransferase family protein [Candidatus Micrarchaeia archaeon]|jgi:protein-S-isoprenylcysteine O-methyltransferase Ste14